MGVEVLHRRLIIGIKVAFDQFTWVGARVHRGCLDIWAVIDPNGVSELVAEGVEQVVGALGSVDGP